MENGKTEVRIRKRGGQPGNTNRLRHGRYTAERIARRGQVMRLTRLGRHALLRVKMILRARKALKRKKAHNPARISVQALMTSSLFFSRFWKMPDLSSASMSRLRPWRAKTSSGSWINAPSLAGSSPIFSIV